MDDGELDFSNADAFLSSDMGGFGNSCDDSLWDEISELQEMAPSLYNCSFNPTCPVQDSLEYQNAHACTHTHTCNPPGPDYSHTHTCVHVHTKIISGPTEDMGNHTDDTAESSEKKSKKCTSGNRAAVRKYRDKKKALAALLEEEVLNLRMVNQQLIKKLQDQAALEAEVARLKCLLVDIRSRIEGEIGSFPYRKSINRSLLNPGLPGSYVMNPCNMQCGDEVYCFHPGTDGKNSGSAPVKGQGFSACEFENHRCLANQNSGINDLPHGGDGQRVSKLISSGSNRKRGGARAAMAS